MRPMRKSLSCWRSIVASAALALLAAPVALAGPRFLRPAAGERLEPGTVVELSWRLDGAPSDAEESELVLSLDGGRTFPIRITGNLDPATRRTLWRVPALPTDQARVALRAGDDEEPAQETLALVSSAFAILASSQDAALEELFAVGSEWRTREALETNPHRTHETGLHTFPTERLHAAPGTEVPAQNAPRSAIFPNRLPTATTAIAPIDSERAP